MSESTATTEPVTTPTEPTEPKATGQGDPAEPLGEGGKKALDAERVARKAAEKATTDLQARLDAIERANESALDKAKREATEAREAATKATAEALRLRVAAKHGISDEDADLLLTGADEETLTKQAKALAARNEEAGKPRPPKPDPNQGRPGGPGPKSAADSFADYARTKL